MIADDNQLNQKVTLLQLQRLGRTADLVSTGDQVLEAIEHKPYAVIFMDCNMPEKDGFQVTHLIRQKEALSGRHVTIIGLTAQAMSGDRERCLAAGMDDYISKPVALAHLQQLLDKWLAPSESGIIIDDHSEIFDFNKLDSAFVGDGAAELVQLFLDSAEVQLESLAQAISSSNASQLSAIAHELKTSGTAFGAVRFAEIALRLEQNALAANWDEAHETATALTHALSELKQFIRPLLSASAG